MDATSILLAAVFAFVILREFAHLDARRRTDRRLRSLEARLPRSCRACGCTDDEACWPDGCHWVEPDLCSACVVGNPTGQGV